MKWTSARVLGVLLTITGCDARQTFVMPEASWQRMVVQPKYLPYRASGVFADGRTMQIPPAHTIARSLAILPPLEANGFDNGRYAEQIPIPVTRAFIETGRRQFDVTCATCHGVLGNGDSVVGHNLQLRHPPSLHDERFRADPPGRLYEVITTGYGLMPSYASQLNTTERWVVVAYVQALQLSQHAPVARLSPPVLVELRRAAP